VALAAGALLLLGLVVAGLRYNGLLQAHNQELQAAAERERAARQRADANYQTANQAIKYFLSDEARTELANIPDMESSRRAMLEAALSMRQKMLRENSNDPTEQLANTQAYRDVADIYLLLGEHDKAEDAFGKAIDGLKKLAAEFPAEPAYRKEQALTCIQLGIAYYQVGKYEAATQPYETAVDLLVRLATEFPGDPDYHHQQARALHNWGNVLRGRGPGPAERMYQRARELEKPLVDQYPREAAYAELLAGILGNQGVLQWTARPPRLEEADKSFREAIDLLQKLVDQNPSERRYREKLAKSYNNRGDVLWARKDSKGYAAAYRRAFDLRKKLVEDFRRVPSYRHDLAVSYESVGYVFDEIGQPDKGEEFYQEALKIKTQLVADFPQVADYASSCGMSLANWARRLRQHKRLAEACSALEKAVEYQQKALQLSPGNAVYRSYLGNASRELADTQAKRRLADPHGPSNRR
jgi:tetratricopeptide (TPR) repeat protein